MPRPKKDKANLFKKITVSLPPYLVKASKKEMVNRKTSFSEIVADALHRRYTHEYLTERDNV